ncbi:MAG: hypothetical protein M3016_00230 [Actinomycetota bacterium]|nr:hypothetical protein [Actinomycetota bacterium]
MAEPLAVLLLPRRLEEFELAAHARDLLQIPRAVALEPPRVATLGFLADVVATRNARRLRFPGKPRVIVLYDPRQYPLARALGSRYQEAELWYARPDRSAVQASGERRLGELLAFDERAAERASGVLVATAGADPRLENEPLRRRLRELEVISSRAFVPGARIHYG